MAAIQARNFQSNSLSGVVSISNGFANLVLSTTPFALEGDKSFVIKLRRGSIQGDVVATSPPITVQDNSSFVSLTANTSSVNEGNLVQFTLVTANAVNGSTLFYSVNPVTANLTISDFYNGSNTGYLTLNNNQAVFALYANTDSGYVDETGETFRVQLRTDSITGNVVYASTSNVVIIDTNKLYNVIGFTENASSVTEGGTITLTFTAHNVPAGTVLYYSTDGNTTSSTFASANTGSFVMNGLSNTISLVTASVPYGITQNFNVKIREGSPTGTLLATSNNLIVADPASISYMSATGGNVSITSDGYKIHTYNVSGTFNVTNLASANIEYLVVAGGGGGGSNQPSYTGGAGGGGGGAVQAGYSILSSTGNFTVTVGAGASQPTFTGLTGSNSSILFGPSASTGDINIAGGTGGGSRGFNSGTGGNSGNGYTGGSAPPGSSDRPGGGGGAGAGGNGNPYGSVAAPAPADGGGPGGSGVNNFIYGIPAYRGGGGGGGANGVSPAINAPYRGFGGQGGGGNGGSIPAVQEGAAPGLVNSGGGGGGGPASNPRDGSMGGSGVVIIKYPFAEGITVTSILPTANLFLVGSNITFTINATNANLTTLYYSTDGNVTASNFIGGNTGSFVANASGGIVTLQANTNIPLNESRSFRLQIRQDSTTGFISGSSANVIVSAYSANTSASGGNQVIDANGYRHHIFLSSNTLTINSLAQTPIEVFSVAGGGGSATALTGPGSPTFHGTGGGGAGGLLISNISLSLSPVSVVVGAGGQSAVINNAGYPGSNTTFGSYLTMVGGGGGGRDSSGKNGGSGGGGGGYNAYSAGSGYGFPSPTQQGYPGGAGGPASPSGDGGGGGGAGGAGAGGGSIGTGGIGVALSWAIPTNYGTSGPAPGRWFAGGGGGGENGPGIYGAPGGAGGGGDAGTSAIVNTGGGGGGHGNDGYNTSVGLGGSGIVIIRYPYS
jgi:hypothetical protein